MLKQMAEGSAQSRYVKLTKEQEAPTEDINPGELNQPIEVPQVLLSVHIRICCVCFWGPKSEIYVHAILRMKMLDLGVLVIGVY